MRTIKQITELEQISQAELNLLRGGNGESNSSDNEKIYIVIDGEIYIITPKGLIPLKGVM